MSSDVYADETAKEEKETAKEEKEETNKINILFLFLH